jgi:uncharacterized protein
MRITVGDAVYRDGDLPLGELIARFDEGVTTSAPAPGDFQQVLDGLPGEVLVLAVSQRLSSTAASARLAADIAGSRVRVIDSGTSAGSLALIALHAARRAQAGGTLAEVEEAARYAVGRARLVAAVGTLDYLVKGGRLPEAVGGLGSRIGLRPMVEVVNDRGVRALRPAFSRHAADERMVRMLVRSQIAGARLHVAALHVLAEEQAHGLLAAVRVEVAPATELVARFGASMVVHTGPNLTGLSWWWE